MIGKDFKVFFNSFMMEDPIIWKPVMKELSIIFST